MKNISKLILLLCCNVYSKLLGHKAHPCLLMYHSFEDTEWKHGVSPRQLKKQLSYLVREKKLVPLSDVVNWIKEEKEIPNNAVAITIDDGYADTYKVFFPLAKKYNIPFTLFLTTDLSRQDKLGDLPRPTWEQLKEMSDSGLMVVGLHGHTHRHFPEVLVEEQLEYEWAYSAELIEKKLSQKPSYVAYPYGRYNQEVIAHLKQAGYVAGVTTRPGFNKVGENLFELKRIGVDRATTFSLFRLRLAPGFPLYLRIIRHFK